MHFATLIGFLLFFVNATHAQTIDTILTWRDYSQLASARVRVYDVIDDKRRSQAVVIDELAENKGVPAITDARFVIQKIGKDLSVDPVSAYWVFRWSLESFDSERSSSKELLLMATIGRSKTNTLTGPTWKVADSQRLAQLTDRKWPSG